jgi:hypothetical protein
MRELVEVKVNIIKIIKENNKNTGMQGKHFLI